MASQPIDCPYIHQFDIFRDIYHGLTKTMKLGKSICMKQLFTCISGSIPFPKIAAIMEIDVKALNNRDRCEVSKE